MTLPDFLVIGAMKGGTTSLWRYLAAHPQVAVAEQKEVHFFSRLWDEGWSWYEDQFPKNPGPRVTRIGEASPSYAELHRFPEVPDRIASKMPDVRLIYLVRDPIDRILSHYRHNLDRGFETKPLPDAVRANETYVGISRYATHIDRYRERFSEGQLLVIESERLRDSRDAVLERIARFLEIDSTWPATAIRREHGKALTLPTRLRIVVRGADRRQKGPLPIEAARAVAVHKRLGRMARMPPWLRDELAEVLRPEVARLRQYMGPDFGGWGLA